MPNRIIKDSINESRGLTNCSFFAQDLYKRIITYADDYGRFNADPQIMLARLYPRELDVVRIDDLEDALVELAGEGKIAFYTSSARKDIYGALPNWSDHQRIRDSKKKAPDPDNTEINDWYLQRFIPTAMKVAILERADFKCQICGKRVTSETDAKRFLKMCTGQAHFDHEVPVIQGGRATMENVRLTCPKCNQSRRKSIDFDELRQLAENRGELRQVAADCGVSRPESNPIQYESKPNPNTNSVKTRFTPPTLDDVQSYCKERNNRVDAERFVNHYSSNGWMVGKVPMKDWKAAVRTWERDEGQRPAERSAKRGMERGEIDDSWAADIMNRPRAN